MSEDYQRKLLISYLPSLGGQRADQDLAGCKSCRRFLREKEIRVSRLFSSPNSMMYLGCMEMLTKL